MPKEKCENLFVKGERLKAFQLRLFGSSHKQAIGILLNNSNELFEYPKMGFILIGMSE